MKSFNHYLEEKLIKINNGAREGQVVFLTGGSGSGKSFAATHFLEGNKFKSINVDDWKELYLKIPNKYPELKGMNLRNPDDVFRLHTFVKRKGIKTTASDSLIAAGKYHLPNIMFDVTLKNIDEIFEVSPKLQEMGYKKENIHIIWVLTDYEVAVKQNRGRSRIVPEDILLQTHEGAANVMYKMMFKNQYPGKYINGGVWVILNGPKHTVLWNPDSASKTGNFVIKDFKYLMVKKPGKAIDSGDIQQQLYTWVTDNIPRSKATEKIFNKEEVELHENLVSDLIKKHSDPYEFAQEAIKMIQSGQLKLKIRGASNVRELVAMFYKLKAKSA